MPDTDPKMMRRQQDKDTPQHIDHDETSAAKDASDTDARSAADRQAAKRGESTKANEQMDAIFNENRRGGGEAAESQFMEDAATDGNASLVRPGRSILGD